MRTTLTLDEDVAAKLKAEARRSGRSFKEIVNDMLRRGLNVKKPRGALSPFKIKARPLGTRPGLHYDKISELLEHIEGPDHR